MDIVQVDIKQLNPAEYNPRKLSEEQFNNIKLSLQRYGFVNPIVVNSNPSRHNIVVGGHQRLKVANELSYTEVPVVYVDLSQQQEKELNIRLNKNTGDWDLESLSEFFTKTELQDWGFDNEELSVLFKGGKSGFGHKDGGNTGEQEQIDLGFEYDEADKMVIIVFYNEQKYNEYQRLKGKYNGEEADLIYDAITQYYGK
jgi:hypothetical protein